MGRRCIGSPPTPFSEYQISFGQLQDIRELRESIVRAAANLSAAQNFIEVTAYTEALNTIIIKLKLTIEEVTKQRKIDG